MNVEHYEDLPDYPDPVEIWELTSLVLRESVGEELSVTLSKLLALSDRQWHSYKIPLQTLREDLQDWLLEHWQSSYPIKISCVHLATILIHGGLCAAEKRYKQKDGRTLRQDCAA